MSEVNRYRQVTFGTVVAVNGVNIVGEITDTIKIDTPPR